MKNLCPCIVCRPKDMTLKQAIKRCHRAAEIQRYGVDGANAREAEKRARLAELKNRRAS